MMRVLFRVDAGNNAGLGHLVRCLALASAIRQRGGECLFLSAPTVEPRVVAADCVFVPPTSRLIGGWDDLAQTLQVARDTQCQAVIVDSYHVDAAYLAQIRNAGFFVVAIDDLAAYPFPCQLVVNGNIYAKTKHYASSSGDTRFLLGPEFILLREEFWNLAPPRVRDRVQNVLILLGGGDPLDLMPRMISTLDSIAGDFGLTLIIGPYFENQKQIQASAKQAHRPIEMVFDPPLVRDYALQADVAISAGGQTIHELLACGCPTIAIPIAENQIPNIEGWATLGAIVPVFRSEPVHILAAIGEQLGALLSSVERRRTLASTGRQCVDGRGARRVAEALLASPNTETVFSGAD